MADDCIFCRIVTREIPAEFVYNDDSLVAFKDIHPVAPVHVLVIPREHVDSLASLRIQHEVLAGHLLQTAAEIARSLGVEESGYRVTVNTGPDSGSEVAHLHLHIIGGRPLSRMG